MTEKKIIALIVLIVQLVILLIINKSKRETGEKIYQMVALFVGGLLAWFVLASFYGELLE